MDDSSPPAAPPPTPPAHTASDPLDASKVASALGSKDGGEDSAPPGPNEAPKRRKVQWVGLSAPHRDEDSQMVDSPRPDNNAEDSPSNSVSHGTGRGGVPHLSIAMPQAAFPLEAAEYSAEGLRINRIHHDDDIPTRPGYELDSGNVTPASGGITPDSSRPASPSSDIDIVSRLCSDDGQRRLIAYNRCRASATVCRQTPIDDLGRSRKRRQLWCHFTNGR